ncbi:MAG: hypothetical protein QOF40_1897 [Actinomycetota bacterium]|nr:hypothetical protein [Actinomycetota bacterium]
MTPDPVEELDGILGATRRAWAAACAAAEPVESVRLVAGAPVRFRLAGPALVDELLPSLCHLAEVRAEPVFTANAWDRRSTGAAVPYLADLPGAAAPSRSIVGTERSVNSSAERRMLEAVDLPAGEGWFAIDSPDDLCQGERAAPFRLVLHWWLAGRGLQMAHGGAVGVDGRGVLIVGRSGAGKSSTTLACVEAGLQYAGDDYSAITLDPTPTVHSLYAMAKVFDGDIARYPSLAAGLTNRRHPTDDKSLFLVPRGRPEHVVRQLSLAALVVPERTSQRVTEFVPATRGDALQALAPSTVGQFPGGAAQTLAALAAVTRSVPAYRLALGTDRATVPPAVRALLDHVEHA